MFLSLLLALSISADALGIGIAYGLRHISFPPLSRLLLAAETFLMMEGFLLLGGLLSCFVPQALAEGAGRWFLFLFGAWLCLRGFGQKKEADSPLAVVHTPSRCDKDGSSVLEPRETLLLGFILSIDSFAIGLSAAVSGMAAEFLPLFAALFQTAFLSIGASVGAKLHGLGGVRESLWQLLSGGLLICIALLR